MVVRMCRSASASRIDAAPRSEEPASKERRIVLAAFGGGAGRVGRAAGSARLGSRAGASENGREAATAPGLSGIGRDSDGRRATAVVGGERRAAGRGREGARRKKKIVRAMPAAAPTAERARGRATLRGGPDGAADRGSGARAGGEGGGGGAGRRPRWCSRAQAGPQKSRRSVRNSQRAQKGRRHSAQRPRAAFCGCRGQSSLTKCRGGSRERFYTSGRRFREKGRVGRGRESEPGNFPGRDPLAST